MLKRLDSVCRENGISYVLAGGTCLGAVRHNGFIPWDDDIDVYLWRDEYEKLMKLRFSDENYEIRNYRYSKGFYFPYAKIVDKNTELYEGGRIDKDMGIFIDIFPLDYLDTAKDKTFNHPVFHKFLISIIYFVGDKLLYQKELSLKFIVKLFLRTLCFPFKKLIIRAVEKWFARFKDGDCCGVTITNKILWKSDMLKETVNVRFEDAEFPIFKEYDYYLSVHYGDYMTMPPVEKRVSNHSFSAYKRSTE
ncbi:MAG: LicD family protein [Eubacterium sp.]|nr:LicD family protein [Eubacterium sp.]